MRAISEPEHLILRLKTELLERMIFHDLLLHQLPGATQVENGQNVASWYQDHEMKANRLQQLLLSRHEKARSVLRVSSQLDSSFPRARDEPNGSVVPRSQENGRVLSFVRGRISEERANGLDLYSGISHRLGELVRTAFELPRLPWREQHPVNIERMEPRLESQFEMLDQEMFF